MNFFRRGGLVTRQTDSKAPTYSPEPHPDGMTVNLPPEPPPGAVYLVMRRGGWPSEVTIQSANRAVLTGQPAREPLVFVSAFRNRADAIQGAGAQDTVVEYRLAQSYKLVLTPEG